MVKKIRTKAKKPRKRVVRFKDGTEAVVPRENVDKVTIV